MKDPDVLARAVPEIKELKHLLRPIRKYQFWRKELSTAERTAMQARVQELSKEIWLAGRASLYCKNTIRAVNDPDELLREEKRVSVDIWYPWSYYCGVDIDKDKLWSYSWYLHIKYMDLEFPDELSRYQTRKQLVNMIEIIEYYQNERGIDLSEFSVIGQVGSSDDPHAGERAMNQLMRDYDPKFLKTRSSKNRR